MLTDMSVKNAKAKDKRRRIADSGGLYLDIQPSGKKTWLFRYADDDGTRHWKTIGDYPVFSLAEARLKTLEFRRMNAGLIQSELRPAKKAPTFREAAEEFLVKYIPTISNAKEKFNVGRRLEMHVYPFIGDKEIDAVTAIDLYAIVERLELRNTYETAKKAIQLCSRVFRNAMLKGWCQSDPCYALKDMVGKKKGIKKHFSAIVEPDQVGELMRKIAAYPQKIVRLALMFSAYTFCRPGEIRHAEWSEIDMDKATWVIPAEKMKMRRDHMVPLAPQAIKILGQMKILTGHCKYVFPSNRAPNGDKPMSENTSLVALRSMGYSKEQMTAHGFRAMASTLLNENHFNHDWVEMQLAHAPSDVVRGIYNRAQYWDERVKMMAWYADYLDSLRDGETRPSIDP